MRIGEAKKLLDVTEKDWRKVARRLDLEPDQARDPGSVLRSSRDL